MKFQLKDLKRLFYSVKDSKISRIYVGSNEFELLVNKRQAGLYANFKISDIRNHNSVNLVAGKSKKKIKKEVSCQENHENSVHVKESTAYSIILSPMVGTFYRCPAPNERPFVETNDVVEKRQTVCIVEAMKLMNEIETEVSGKIVDILVKDGEIVDCGQALMKVQT